MVLGWSLWLLLVGCAEPSCDAAVGSELDACLHLQVSAAPAGLPASDLLRISGRIQDRLVRDATVMLWVRNHRGGVTRQERDQICGLFEGLERSACQRRLDTAHLQRPG
jgi:hypothetical protein